jgi:NADPH-dependent 2,4-dienoyl-CoA reductase/sulfur reductase-like enzyme
MKIAIIGNGISGISAARWIRKLSDLEIHVISSESKHFFSRTALMYIYMGHMTFENTKPYEDWFWKKNRINLIQDYVTEIDFDNKALTLSKDGAFTYDKLIIAVGSKSNKFGWPGQDLDGVRGLYNLQDLEEMEKFSPGLKRAVIVGGGLIGIEMAEMFHSRNIPVTMVVREESYWNNVLPIDEANMISNHIKEHHIDLRLGMNLQEIIDDGNGRACGIIIKETGERIDCGFVGLTPGVSPNIAFLKEGPLETNRGVRVNKFLETNIPEVYAIGDCAEQTEPAEGRAPIEAVWYTGRIMGETVAYNICGKQVPYNPGIWFNSAKFLDIEYQVYGTIKNNPPENHISLFWKHSDGRKSVRIVYNKDDNEILGFNLFGIRFRHEVCEKWIRNGTHIEDVLQNLSLANFDPEFYSEYEDDIIKQYNHISGGSLVADKKRNLNQVLSFLKK